MPERGVCGSPPSPTLRAGVLWPVVGGASGVAATSRLGPEPELGEVGMHELTGHRSGGDTRSHVRGRPRTGALVQDPDLALPVTRTCLCRVYSGREIPGRWSPPAGSLAGSSLGVPIGEPDFDRCPSQSVQKDCEVGVAVVVRVDDPRGEGLDAVGRGQGRHPFVR